MFDGEVVTATGDMLNKETKPTTNMAKPSTKSASSKPAKTAEPEITPDKKTRKGGAVLIKTTASQLHDLIGDAEIGVSKKELHALVTAAKVKEALAEAGLD